jgi:hypothetical protein
VEHRQHALTGIRQLEYTNGDSAADAMRSYKRKAWYLSVEQKLAAGQSIYGLYGEADDGALAQRGAGVPDRGHGREVLRARLHLPLLEAHRGLRGVLQPRQQGSARSPLRSGTVVAPGADTTGAGVGMIHYF